MTPGSACGLAVDTVTAMQQATASQLPQTTTVALHSAEHASQQNPLGATEGVSAQLPISPTPPPFPAPSVDPLVPRSSGSTISAIWVWCSEPQSPNIRVDQHTEVQHYITATMMMAQTGDGIERCHKRNDSTGKAPLAVHKAQGLGRAHA